MVGGATAAVAELRCFAWAFPLSKIEDWVACTEAAHAAVCTHTMATTVKQLLCKSVEVLRFVPSYEHLMSGRSLNLETCKKFLVGWPSKKASGQGRYALEQAIVAASEAGKHWGFSAPVQEHPSYEKDFLASEANLKRAKMAVATIAGCTCLMNMRGAEQLAKRDALKAQQKLYPLMPALLVKQLEALR